MYTYCKKVYLKIGRSPYLRGNGCKRDNENM